MKLIFKGVVQGVGFRPTIYRVAKQLNLKGYVLNKGSEVEVVVDKNHREFIDIVKKNLPSIAKISDISIELDGRRFNDFKIIHSKDGKRQSLIPVDIGLCKDCLKEIFDKKNRRYLFPFTNCTVCGARYSLIKKVPYDRERTSMSDFKLCKQCTNDYTDPLNRRYHAQTISCPVCGPRYRLFDKNQKDLGEEESILRFARQIDSGKIGVLKSWGGMHICCKIDEIKSFRQWYNRPQKSFAVMVRDIETAREYADITNAEQELLQSKSKPIVLLEKKKAEDVSPGLNSIGLFLPYTGLHHILFSYLENKALIMTSANLPGEPMMTQNEEVFSLGADYYLLHNRDIPNRIDDSVVKLWKNKTFFLRKSRGSVPDPLDVSYKDHILSVGPDENITGSISIDKKIFSTQYIGNSRYYNTIIFLEESLRHLMNLMMKKPHLDAVAMDLHPGYDTRKVAKKFSDEFSIPCFEVQHDQAHVASLLVDNKLEEIVALVVEGLGYGTDGTFWGGDVFYSDFKNFERVGHLEYIPLLGGDQATVDPRRLVYAIFNKIGKEKYFRDIDAKILNKLIKDSLRSCSLGRYLDAISCFLDICKRRTYSGEPAMKLEKYLAKGHHKLKLDLEIKNNVVQVVDLFRQVDEKFKSPFSESDKADISYSMVKRIVEGLSDIAIEYAQNKGLNNIGLTGGVSYNIPITNIVLKRIESAGLNLVVHNRVPNGDGGTSIGQNAIVGYKLMS